jgi:hypothetical protein
MTKIVAGALLIIGAIASAAPAEGRNAVADRGEAERRLQGTDNSRAGYLDVTAITADVERRRSRQSKSEWSGVPVDPAATIFGGPRYGGKRNGGTLYQLTALP